METIVSFSVDCGALQSTDSGETVRLILGPPSISESKGLVKANIQGEPTDSAPLLDYPDRLEPLFQD